MPTYTSVILTPRPSGTVVTLQMPEDVNLDAIGNVTFTFEEPLNDVLPTLQGMVSSNVQQLRNRAAVFLVDADPGAKLLDVTWGEIQPYANTVANRTVRGVASLGQYQVSRAKIGWALVIYRADVLRIRTTGALIT
jgi:hypothetical protein